MNKKFRKINKDKGFVILFAITLASILLAITLGVANIALKEINFSSSARDSNEAFFAADTAIECALANDKGDDNPFVPNGPGKANCLNTNIDVAGDNPWSFTIAGLGNATPPRACAVVTVTKDIPGTATAVRTVIDSKGYNTGDSNCASSPNRIERELQLSYGSAVIAYVGEAHNSVTSLSSGQKFSINKPSGLYNGNIMIAVIAFRPASLSPSLSGWTLIRQTNNNTDPVTNNSLATFYKIATANEPSTSYDWDLGGDTSGIAGGIIAFSGVNPTNPIKISEGRNTSNTSLASPSPDVDTGDLHTMVITAHGISSSSNWIKPEGMLEAFQASSLTPIQATGESIEVNYVTQPLNGPTGVKIAVQTEGDATNPGLDYGNSQIIVLKP